MEFMDLVRARYSVRKFDPRPVEEEKLQKVLEAGRLAPTAKNNQPQRVYVIESREAMEKLRALSPCIYGAPTALLVCYDTVEDWHNAEEPDIRSGVEDASIVATHMMLEAAELGLGTCWVNRFPNSATERAFSLPETERSVLLLPLGYPAADAAPAPRHTDRKPLGETVKRL